MRYSMLLAGLLTVALHNSIWATSWGLNSFADSVNWADAIVIGKVNKVTFRAGNHADVTIRIIENLKGTLSGDLSVTQLDLGDATVNASPFPPLPARLVGQELLLLLRRNGAAYEASSRGVVQDGKVTAMAFMNMQEAGLSDIRAMIVELQLVQRLCPADRHADTNELAASAACHVALHSRYSQVQWYAARRLLDRPIPNHLLDDLAVLAGKQQSQSPIRYLLVQCLDKIGDPRAVAPLVGILRSDPTDIYTAKALQGLTGKQFRSLVEWENWLKERDSDKAAKKDALEDAAGLLIPHKGGTLAVLLQALHAADVNVNDLAMRALAEAGEEALPPLVELLTKADFAVRIQAARVLGRMGPKAKSALPALIEAAKLSNVGLRWEVMRALGNMGPAAKVATPTLLLALKDPFAGIRASAARALGEIGSADRDVVSALKMASMDADVHAQKAATTALQALAK